MRILPGTDPEIVIERVRAIVSKWDIKVEVIEAQSGFEFVPDDWFVEAVQDAIRAEDDKAVIVPYMLPASSDAKYLVRKGIKTYGFFPMTPKRSVINLLKLVHGVNERIEIVDLLFAVRVYYRLLKKLCG